MINLSRINVKRPYWLNHLLAFFLASISIIGFNLITRSDGHIFSVPSIYTLWGLFWGFSFSFSLIAMGRYILQPSMFVLSLTRILFFGYCMVVTSDSDSTLLRLELLGFFTFLATVTIISITQPRSLTERETSIAVTHTNR